MRIAVFVSLAMLTGESVEADSLAAAEQLFLAGKYAEAAAIYDRCAASGPQSAAFYRNQGNLHLLAGNPPRAILAFRQFVRLTTIHTDVYTNWREARSLAGAEPGQTAWSGRLGLSFWLYPLWMKTALAAVVWFLGTTTMYLAMRSRPRWFAIGGLDLGWSLAVALFFHERDVDQHPFLVVAQDNVVMRQGNGLSFPPLRANGKDVTLHSGTEARKRGERPNGWVQLELPDGRIGWVHRQQVLIDE